MKYDEMISRRGLVMLSYLRKRFYQDSSRMLELLDTMGLELDGVWYTFDDIRDQCFIDRATWGLEIWEDEFGLQPGPSDTYEVRRARIKAKIIGFGSFTEAVARELANAYSRSGSALFIPMYAQYSFKTQYAEDDLISYAGLKAAFDEAKPAHLQHLIGLLMEIAFPFDAAAKAKVKGKALLDSATSTAHFRLRTAASILGFDVSSRTRLYIQAVVQFPPVFETQMLVHSLNEFPASALDSRYTLKAFAWFLGVGDHDNIDPQSLQFNGAWYFDGSQQFNGINAQGMDLYYELAVPCSIRHIRNGQVIAEE